MSMSAIFQKCRVSAYCGILAVRTSLRLIHTFKMAEKSADYSAANGFESKTPFLIGVAGGTASGKVSLTLYVLVYLLSIFSFHV